jgi:effector-binding domain-containing protein
MAESYERETEPHVVHVTARAVAGVSARIPRGSVPREFGRHLDRVYAAARAGAVSLDGQNIFIYRDAAGELLDVDFCVGVNAPFAATGAVHQLATPTGRAATATHVGGYDSLGVTHRAIVAWCEEHGYRLAGPSWEVYGHWHDDPAALRTSIFYLLQPGIASDA